MLRVVAARSRASKKPGFLYGTRLIRTIAPDSVGYRQWTRPDVVMMSSSGAPQFRDHMACAVQALQGIADSLQINSSSVVCNDASANTTACRLKELRRALEGVIAMCQTCEMKSRALLDMEEKALCVGRHELSELVHRGGDLIAEATRTKDNVQTLKNEFMSFVQRCEQYCEDSGIRAQHLKKGRSIDFKSASDLVLQKKEYLSFAIRRAALGSGQKLGNVFQIQPGSTLSLRSLQGHATAAGNPQAYKKMVSTERALEKVTRRAQQLEDVEIGGRSQLRQLRKHVREARKASSTLWNFQAAFPHEKSRLEGNIRYHELKSQRERTRLDVIIDIRSFACTTLEPISAALSSLDISLRHGEEVA